MATQQDTMRKLINLLEAVESAPEVGKAKVPPASPQEARAIADLVKELGTIEEGWKGAVAAGAISLASLFSAAAHAANPGGLIDTSSPAATAASCSVILNAAISSGKLPFNALDGAQQVGQTYAKIVNNIGMGNDAKAQGAVYTATRATQQKIQSLQDKSPVFQAAGQCASFVR